MSPDYLSTSAAARAVGHHKNTLLRWVQTGKITPSYRTPGGHLRWDLNDLRRQLGHPRRRPS